MSAMADPPVPPFEVSSTEDPRVLAAATTEDYALHVVPLSWRMGRWSLASVWWSLATAMFWLIIGALVALTVGTVNAIIGMVLAAIVYALIQAYFARHAADLGITSNLFSQALFGARGSVIAPLLVALTAIYFGVFESSVIAIAFQAYFGGPVQLWYAVVVIYSVPLIFGALRVFLDKFNGFLFPLYLIGLIAAIVWTALKFGDTGWLTQRPAALAVSGPGWWWAFTTYMADFLLMMATWDFARLARTRPADRRFHATITFGPVFTFFTLVVNGVAGIFIALTIPSPGTLSETSGVVGVVGLMGVVGLGFVWVSQTRINTTNYYLAVTNLESFFSRLTAVRLSRIAWAVAVGVIIFVVMLADIFDFLLVSLRYEAVLTATWTACALAFLVLRARFGAAGAPEWRPLRVVAWNAVGITAWAVGALSGIALLAFGSSSSWTGTWALPIAFVVSFALQAVGMWLRRNAQPAPDQAPDPRDEVPDPWRSFIRCQVCTMSYTAEEMDRDPHLEYAAVCAEHAASPRSTTTGLLTQSPRTATDR